MADVAHTIVAASTRAFASVGAAAGAVPTASWGMWQDDAMCHHKRSTLWSHNSVLLGVSSCTGDTLGTLG